MAISEDERMFLNMSDEEYAAWLAAKDAESRSREGEN
jgi:hypothetical protein